MAQKKKRKKTANKKYSTEKIIKAVVVVIVILILVSIAAFQFGDVTYSSLGSSISDALSKSGRGDGFPYEINGSTAKNMKMSSSDLVVLYDTGVKVIDSTAKELSDLQHNYSSSLMDVFSSRILVLDSNGKKFRVQSHNKIISEVETSFDILTGDISKSGFTAIATKSDSATSMLTVYDKNQKEIFKWLCAKEQIVTVDISDNGSYVAVGVIGAESGDIYSNVYLFDTDFAEPVQSLSFPGSSVVGVEMLSGKNFLIVADNKAVFVDKKGNCNEVDVSLNTVSRYSTSESNITALLLSKYSSAYSKILNIYNGKGKQLCSVSIEYPVKSISCDGSYVSVLTNESVLTYNLQGELVGSNPVASDSIKCCVDGRSTYVLTSNDIEKYSSIGIAKENDKSDTEKGTEKESDSTSEKNEATKS